MDSKDVQHASNIRRSTLHAMRFQSEKKPHSNSITDHSSYVNYRYLSSEELKTRLVNVHKEKRASEKRMMRKVEIRGRSRIGKG